MKKYAPFLTIEQRELMNLLIKDNKNNIYPRLNHFYIKKENVICKLYNDKAVIQDSKTRYTISNNAFEEYYDLCTQLSKIDDSNEKIKNTIKELVGEDE